MTWFEISDSRSNTLHHTSALMSQHCGKTPLVLPFKQVVEVSVTHTCSYNLQDRRKTF